MKRSILSLSIMVLCLMSAAGQKDGGAPSISEKTKGLSEFNGFFDYFWDEGSGKIYLETGDFGKEFLMVSYLSR
ncbi:hypothetical protein LCGC14_3094740, partial [marine sediment metagenome]